MTTDKDAAIVHEHYIEEIESRGEGLTDWEMGFVSEMDALMRRGYKLSEKQAAQLQKIYDERVK